MGPWTEPSALDGKHVSCLSQGKTKLQLLCVHNHVTAKPNRKTSCLAVWTPSTTQDVSITRRTQTKLTNVDLSSSSPPHYVCIYTCPSFFFLHSLFACSLAQKGSGSYVHFRPRPRSSTSRWARLATHGHSGPHTECSPCSHAHFGCATTARVSSPKRRGSLRRLTHAAGRGHFLDASTSGRSVPFV